MARYPGADKLLIWREYMYVSCTLLAASSHWDDEQKWDKWMQLMNRWNAPTTTDATAATAAQPPSELPPSQSSTSTATSAPAEAPPAEMRLSIGGVGLGTSLAEIQARKDITLSLDSYGNPYGEEIFTFSYGLRQLDGDVVFGVRDSTVSSITVTHILRSATCPENAIAATVLDDKVRGWGAPLSHVAAAATLGGRDQTASYTFRSGNVDMIIVFQTTTSEGRAPICRVSMNYQRSLSRS